MAKFKRGDRVVYVRLGEPTEPIPEDHGTVDSVDYAGEPEGEINYCVQWDLDSGLLWAREKQLVFEEEYILSQTTKKEFSDQPISREGKMTVVSDQPIIREDKMTVRQLKNFLSVLDDDLIVNYDGLKVTFNR